MAIRVARSMAFCCCARLIVVHTATRHIKSSATGRSTIVIALTASVFQEDREMVLAELEEPRHISGEELANGVRKLALKQYGPMARTVLGHWGIHGTEDLGEIVFAMVECGVLVKQEEDRREDFQGLFDFEDVFEREYPWGGRV